MVLPCARILLHNEQALAHVIGSQGHFDEWQNQTQNKTTHSVGLSTEKVQKRGIQRQKVDSWV